VTNVLTLTGFRPEAPGAGLLRASAVIIVGIGAAIAAITPFDRAFDTATFDSPALRATLLVALAAIGLMFAAKVGAPIESRGLRHPIRTPLLIAAGVAVYLTVLDVWVFRSILAPGYLAFISGASLVDRLGYFMLRAFNESILYRLFLSSVLVWAFGLLWRHADGRPANRAYWVGIVVAQALNIAVNVTFLTAFSTTPALLLHDGLRYILPGVLWGYLYFRHGFTTHEIAAVGTHLFFQPFLSLALQ
jgi:hypothetical protein